VTTAGGARWELYRLLSEPVRLQLLALAAAEELAIGELADLLGESQPNVSRHAAPLKAAGLLTVRKQGTRQFVRLHDGAAADPVVADALAAGKALCEESGALARIGDVLRARDAVGREFFAQPVERDGQLDPRLKEWGIHLAALAPLIARRGLAVDIGTGDGSFLHFLAPVFDRVVGIDRSPAQLAQARATVDAAGYTNVTLVQGSLDDPAVREAVKGGADAVFAVRLLHHAPQPQYLVKALASMCKPGGAIVVLDYVRHDDETMRKQADLWLGFEPTDLERFARSAGIEDARVSPIAGGPTGRGPDGHLPWQVLVGHRGGA
jgi:ArsR family transcriptional regulator